MEEQQYLSHITRGGVSAQGKQKVYFACHPDDFDLYFEEIKNDIFATQNCAVFYKTPGVEYTDEELFDLLKDMRLFVVPVTSRLLLKSNHAMEKEIPFAFAEDIPVLPLMQEYGLEEIYSRKEKFGDLQYLDKHERDDTAIPFSEKLKNYLDSLLIGDELAEKIRNAFDAYIFLSYRKKDRKYAQELMRLIHQNEFCRDIAIWYDEFLIPGEGFNDAIRAAMEKSRLFALAVTPNLVNEENYVRTVEFPKARDAGKPILPAEMVSTDREKLEALFEGIPACVDAHDGAVLAESLSGLLADSSSERLRGVAPDGIRKTPLHNYFIGLAYLSGIDVEVDHDMALRLIRSSAEAGLPEAMEKLAVMYKTADGVKRDFDASIVWRKRLAKRYTEIFRETHRADDALNMENALWRLGNDCKVLGKHTEAKRAYQTMLEMLDEVEADWERRYAAVSYGTLGDIAEAEGKLDEAKGCYEKSLAICRDLAEDLRTPEAKSDLSICYKRLGDIANIKKKLSVAKAYYRHALSIDASIAKETQTPEARRNLSVCYNSLGNIAQAERDFAGAREYYEKELAGFSSLAEETQTPGAKRDLSIGYNNLGDIAQAEREFAAAKRYYERSLAIRLSLAGETQAPEAKRDLSVCYSKLGNTAKAMNDLAAAKAFYEKALGIDASLAEETKTPEAKRDLSVSYSSLGDIALYAKKNAAAKEYYEKALAIDFALAKETKTPEAKRDLSVGYSLLGDIFKLEKEYAKAKTYYQKALAIDSSLAEETKTPEAKRDLSVGFNRLGAVSRAEGNLAEAKEYYGKALAIRLVLAEETKTPEAKRELSLNYIRLGAVAEAENCLAEAKAYYEKALAIRLALAEETKTPEVKRDLSGSYERLGRVAEAKGNFAEARDNYEKSLAACRDFAEATRTPEAFDTLAVSYYTLASAVKDFSLMKKAFELWNALARKCPGVMRYKERRDIVKQILQENGEVV